MNTLVTGGAGFIGSNLVKNLLSKGKRVLVLDKFTMGNLIKYNHPKLLIIKTDISNYETFEKIIKIENKKYKFENIYHLAANSDISKGVDDLDIDFKDTFKSTLNSIKIAKKFNILNFYFASSSAIYGDLGKNIKESSGPLMPISNYGAMKLASEALISSAKESFLKNLVIFRFPNVVGTPASHGVIYDFFKKLKLNKNLLEVMGDGNQKKAYLHINDLISAMVYIIHKTRDNNKCNIYNIGPNDQGIRVKDIAKKVVLKINPNAKIIYGNDNKGWVGDVPKFSYNIDKLKDLGWSKLLSSDKAISSAIEEIFDEVTNKKR